jgi:hypothetical protein
MKRRNFLASLAALAVAPKAISSFGSAPNARALLMAELKRPYIPADAVGGHTVTLAEWSRFADRPLYYTEATIS